VSMSSAGDSRSATWNGRLIGRLEAVVMFVARLLMMGAWFTASTVTMKDVWAMAEPSVTEIVTVAVPLASWRGVMVSVRSAPVPLIDRVRRPGLSVVAAVIRLVTGVSASSIWKVTMRGWFSSVTWFGIGAMVGSVV